ncbi:MAG: PAS domain S-box protein, partial [Halobacteria archaeon]|nr:PAS domain S-box protein [Halobacteria archaeon]
DSEVEQVIGLSVDITQQRQRETELEIYETMMNAVADIVYAIDDEGRFIELNQTAEDILGYEPDEIIGEHVSVIMNDEDIRRGEDLIMRLLSDDSLDTESYEHDIVTADGRSISCETNIGLLETEDGEFLGSVGVTRDITERKERERELEEYKTLVENIGDPMYALDDRGYLTMVNEALEEQVGYDRDELIGEHVLKLMPPEDFERGTDIILELLEDDEDEWKTFEMVVEDAEGNRKLYEDNIAVLT